MTFSEFNLSISYTCNHLWLVVQQKISFNKIDSKLVLANFFGYETLKQLYG